LALPRPAGRLGDRRFGPLVVFGVEGNDPARPVAEVEH